MKAIPLAGGAASVVSDISGAWRIAQSGDRVFVVSSTDEGLALHEVPVTGGTATLLSRNLASGASIAATDGDVYYPTQGYELVRVRPDEDLEVVGDGASTDLGAHGKSVYWNENFKLMRLRRR